MNLWNFSVEANIVYTLIGAIINGASVFRVIAGILIFMVGLAYIALEMVPSVSPPDNMNLVASIQASTRYVVNIN